MAWTYNDYITLDGSARLTRLRLHIQEVSAKVRPDMSSSPGSVSTGALGPYLDSLRAEESSLANSVGTSQSRFTRGRPV